MRAANSESDMGCLVIDGFLLGEDRLSGLCLCQAAPSMRAMRFCWREGEALHEALQAAHQSLRSEEALAAIVARGLGCAAALALAEQLPVARLALIEPELIPGPAPGSAASPRWRQLKRLCAFARRNMPLCVSDALVVEGEGGGVCRALRSGGLCAHSRLIRLKLPGAIDKSMYINREFNLKSVINGFLLGGELPKSLAENREMCIIYG